MRLIRQARTLALYFAIPAMAAVTPFIVFPALTSQFGARGLAAAGIAQSLGAAGQVCAELGWSVLGPQRVSRAKPEDRSRMYESALATRLMALVVFAPLAGVSAAAVSVDFKWEAAVIAVAFTTMALSPSWFMIGLNRPMSILYAEALPRLLIYGTGAALILAGGSFALYGFAVLLAVVVTQVLAAITLKQRMWPRWAAFAGGAGVIRSQFPVTLGRMVSVFYTALPIAIVGLVSPASVATFTAAERLLRMALSFLGGIPSRLQSWVGQGSAVDGLSRSRKSLAINAALGLVSGIAFALGAPLIVPFIFSGTVSLGFEITAISGCIVFAVCASRGFGLSLVAEGRANSIGVANLVAAVVGIGSIYGLAGSFGVKGGVLGELAAEVAGLMVQAAVLCMSGRGIQRRGGK